MQDRIERCVGILLALTGVGMLASMDIPLIQRGGLPGGFAVAELAIALLAISLGLGSGMRHT